MNPGVRGEGGIFPAPGGVMRIALPAVSALLLLGAFPKPDLGPLAWVALVPWFLLLGRLSPRSGGITGLLFGGGFFGGLLYWTVPALHRHGGLSPLLSLAAFGLLVLYLSLFPAALAAAAGAAGQRGEGRALLFLPFGWVALEWIRAHLFGGFPWGLLGYTQYRHPGWIQPAAVGGVYAVSFLVAAGNALIAAAGSSPRRLRPAPIVAAAALLAVLFLAGRGLPPEPGPESIRVAAIQADIRQDWKWEDRRSGEILDRYFRLTREAFGTGPDLVIWPEAALPYPLGPGPPGGEPEGEPGSGVPGLRPRLQALVAGRTAGLLFGAVEYRQTPAGLGAANSAQYLAGTGRWAPPYAKVRLVPFVEVVPVRPLLPFLNRIAGGSIADFVPGDGPVLHEVGGARFATAICYEMIFPHLIRGYVGSGAEFLVNITNDGWFGDSAGPGQHFAMSVLRAVETRRWVVRVANTGISGFIDPHGRIREETAVHTTRVLVGRIRPGRDTTFYVRFGDAFAGACGIIALGSILIPARRGPAPRPARGGGSRAGSLDGTAAPPRGTGTNPARSSLISKRGTGS